MKVFHTSFAMVLPWLFLQGVASMFAKRQRCYEDKHEPPERRFRSNAAELFLDNTLSGDRVLSLLEDAHAAGAAHVQDLCGLLKSHTSSCKKNKFRTHAQRDLLRRLLKRCSWPPLYYAPIRIFDQKTQTMQSVECPFMLPHEIVHVFLQGHLHDQMLETQGMSASCLENLEKMKQLFSQARALALGLWIDGVPFNWDRSETLECIAISFPGLSGVNKNLRVPVCVISKRFLVKDVTYEDILDILSWSFIWLGQGLFPPSRHDCLPFRRGQDKQRLMQANKAIGISGFLCELRGDWKMLSEIIKVPAWNLKSGCCFKCSITLATIRDFDSSAAWRQPANRINNWQFLLRLHSQGLANSNIFKCPGFTTYCIALDWLHCCDLGVAADFLGNLFWMLLPFQVGSTTAKRVSSLFIKMQDYYKQEQVQDQLKNLTESMLRKKASSSPKLRAKAAETRGLIKFAAQQATLTFHGNDPVEQAAKYAAIHLENCYKCLASSAFDHETLQNESLAFCMLYKALEQDALSKGSVCWRVKPKFHVWQELCMMPGNPADSWAYRDEDLGGSLASVARRRGGRNTVLSTGASVLNKFRAKHQPFLK